MAKKSTPKSAPKKAGKAAKPAKKAVAKKAAPKKAAKKPAAKKAAPVKKKVVKKAAVKKPAAKKAAPKKVVKPVAKKIAKAAPAKKQPAPKTGAKKVVPAKQAAPQKPASKPVTKPTTPVAKAPAKTAPVAAPAAPKAATPKPAGRPKRSEAKVKEEKSAAPVVRMSGNLVMPKAAPIVKKQVSTLESADKERYADDELDEFRQIINKKLDEARKDYDLLKQTLANNDNNGTDDTSPSFKMIEDGSETLSREETAQLAARQEKFIKHLEDALLRIRNKTYGICRVTGRLISKERLRLVPHATLSIEAKQQLNN